MPYTIYTRVIRLRPVALAAAMASLIVAPVFSPNADVEAGINAARHGNFKMAHAEFLREAGLGNPHAQVLVGELYHKGRGVEQSYAQAAIWYQRAAEWGHPVAQYMLGGYYRRGLGIDRDPTRAFQWYQRAADQNLALAQYTLAIHYRDGIGVPADQNAASAWFEKAARQGLAEAQINLGLRYWRGNNVPEDKFLTYAWMRKAVGQGDVSAVQTLREFEKSMSEEDVPAGKNLSLTLNRAPRAVLTHGV